MLSASGRRTFHHWRKIDIPHDWSIEGPFDEKATITDSGGSRPSGIA
jgi:beta-galactosidase